MGNNYYNKRNLYTDAQILECYQRHESQTKAAAELGISRETVARAVRRCGVPLTGRRLNGREQGESLGKTNITNQMLREEAQSLSCEEIAKKYRCTAVSIARRLKRLGIEATAFGTGGRYFDRVKEYGSEGGFNSQITLIEVAKRDNNICQICGGVVDWGDIENGHIRRMYPTIDHIVPLSKGGRHTWENVQLAHMSCNAHKFDKITV